MKTLRTLLREERDEILSEDATARMKEKRLYGADNARYKTGHVIYNTASERVGGYRLTKEVRHGTVTHHTADTFKVRWDGGHETKHRQSDGREYGAPSRNSSFLGFSQPSAPSHMPSEFKTPEEHKAHVAKSFAAAKAEHEAKESHASRVRTALSNLSSHHPSDLSHEHIARMEQLHSDIAAHKQKKQ